mmetsp:Transcript_27662/g.57904  ORF Transcript_27662/g.57904 Transcript_27662/m.57904 type:complete len:242 (+) Transcript_27662:528-1253(+)
MRSCGMCKLDGNDCNMIIPPCRANMKMSKRKCNVLIPKMTINGPFLKPRSKLKKSNSRLPKKNEIFSPSECMKCNTCANKHKKNKPRKLCNYKNKFKLYKNNSNNNVKNPINNCSWRSKNKNKSRCKNCKGWLPNIKTLSRASKLNTMPNSKKSKNLIKNNCECSKKNCKKYSKSNNNEKWSHDPLTFRYPRSAVLAVRLLLPTPRRIEAVCKNCGPNEIRCVPSTKRFDRRSNCCPWPRP